MAEVTNWYNALIGGIVAILSMIFGQHWFLFAAFLALNVLDMITGIMKARLNGKDNSSKGLKGVVKKFGYWIMILVSFLASTIFVEIGVTLGVDLHVTTLIGYFVLCSLIINELRSILENFVEAGYEVPAVLINGLQVAEKMLNKDEE